MRLDAIWIAGGVFAAAATTPEISEWAALAFAVAAGLAGGFVASGWTSKPLDRAGVLRCVIASGMVAPALVLGAVTYMANGGDVVYRAMPVAAASGLAGLVAWPLASLLHTSVSLIRPGEIANALRRFVGLPEKP